MKIAFFPGKFQPPHLGHIQTLMKLYPDYDKIFVGITGGEPRILSLEKTKEIFETVLKHLPKFKVVLIKGTLVYKESLEELPKFDVLVTGNDEVVEWANKMGIKSKFLPRSTGIGYNGTELRMLDKKKKTR